MELKTMIDIITKNETSTREAQVKLNFLYEKTLDMCDALGNGVDKDECMAHYANKIIPSATADLNEMDKNYVLHHAQHLVKIMDGYTKYLDNSTIDNVKQIMEETE